MEMERIGIFKTVSWLFSMGNPWSMIPIALCLVAVLIAAWKAPRWVREFGLAAFIIGLLAFAVRFHYGIRDIEDIAINLGHDNFLSPSTIIDGFRHNIIAPICGLLVFILSQIIGLVQSSKR